MTTFKELLLESKDGEWGKGDPSPDHIPMLCIRGTDFERIRIGAIENVPVRQILNRHAARKTLQPNDILLETAGGSRDRPTGRSVLLRQTLFDTSPYPLICASFARFLRVDQGQAAPAYVFWLLQEWYSNRRMLAYHTQHTGVARFQYTTFAATEEIPLPPLPTQRRIASILSAYDDLIENNTKRIEILEEMARSLYREWFVHFRFPGHEKVKLVDSELGKIPEGWEVLPLSEVFDTSSGGTPSRKHPEYYEGGEIPWVKTRELNDTWIIDTEEKITELGLKKSSAKLFPKGTLLVAMYGATVGVLGVLDLDACTNQACCAVLPKNGSAFGLAFARGYFFEIRQQLIGQALGAAQPNISQQVICRQPVVRPPESLAGLFEQTSGPILELSGNLIRKNQVLRQTRDILLPKLISGEIDVDALDLPEAS